MECWVEVDDGVRLWVEVTGDEDAEPLLLVMGANASGLTWPDELVERLATRHRVIRYDHRDTGRSTWAYDERPYAVSDLAADAVAVLETLDAEGAHVVGMSMGGVLVQLMLLDFPELLRSATVFCTTALGSGLASEGTGDATLPDPDPRLLELWEHLADPRDEDAEVAFRVEHWRILNGEDLPFDAEAFRRMERRVIAHAGRHDNPAAHARAAQTGLDRGRELAGVRTPTLVVEAPRDPINPPPHAERLARAIPGSRLESIPGMGHALAPAVIGPLADAILEHTMSAPA
jgi:pimeloyl-ACP methyl ester carboxylesterase